MRKSKSRSTTRMATAAGLTTGVVGAALFVAPTAAFAAIAVNPPVVPAGGVVTITDTSPSPVFPTSSVPGTGAARVQILTGTPGSPACAATLPAASATIVVADATYLISSTANTVRFRMPTAATAGTNGQAKRYIACVYDDDTTARAGSTNGYPVFVGTQPTVAQFGPSGGGNVLEFRTSTPVFNAVPTVAAQFTTAESCPTTWGTPTANLVATTNRISDNQVNITVPAGVTTGPDPSTSTAPVRHQLCVYNGATSTSTLVSTSSYTASLLESSQQIGSWQGLNALNLTSPVDLFAGIDSPGVLLQTAACESTYEVTGTASLIPVTQDDVRKVTDNRVALTLPAFYANSTAFTAALTAAATAGPTDGRLNWNVCVYAGNIDETSGLIASHPYTVTTVHTATAVTPTAGPALGGNRIVVTGTAFPLVASEITATLGGAPLTNITPISSTAFSAIAPMRAPANNVALAVTTPMGSFTLPNAYSFTSALRVSPNTAPNTRAVPVVIRGVGFQSAPFTNGGADPVTGAHFYLVKGTYSSADTGSARANPPVTDCTNVLVLSDTEAVCTLNLNRRLVAPTGATRVAAFVPAAAAAIAGLNTTLNSRIITADAAYFNNGHIGQILQGADNLTIPANTTVVEVIDSTTAVLSNAALLTDTDGFSARWLTPVHRSNLSVTISGTTTATGTGGTVFTQADVGKVVIGTRITDATTTITSVNTANNTATLSAAATNGSDTLTLHAPYVPVPEGAYNLTYVSSGATGALGGDPDFVQSQISSASTFTVASY